MVEKGLEVLAWMRGAGIQPTGPVYEELLHTIEIASLWDSKVFARHAPDVVERKPSRQASKSSLR